LKDIFITFYGNLTTIKCYQFFHILNKYLTNEWVDVNNYPDEFLPANRFKHYQTKRYVFEYCCQHKKLCALHLWQYTYNNMKPALNYLFSTNLSTIKQALNETKQFYFTDIDKRFQQFIEFKSNKTATQVFYEYLKHDWVLDMVLYGLLKNKLPANELYQEEALLLAKANYMFKSILTFHQKRVIMLIQTLKTRKEG